MLQLKYFATFAVILAFILLQVDCLIFFERPLQQPSSSAASQLHASPRNSSQQSREKRDQLHRVIQSIEFYGREKDDTDRGASEELLEAMKMLSRAGTQKDVTMVGNVLEELDIVEKESFPIQERVLKATALSGLFPTSLKILKGMLDSAYFPSRMAYTALCSALRRAGRNKQLEELMYDLAEIARQQGTSVDVVAWNIYLASICQSVGHSKDPALARVWKWMDPTVAKEQFCTEPDEFSFNTILFAAARVGNRTLVEAVYEELKQRDEIQPNIRTYNSRLMVSSEEECLDILEEIQVDPSVSPDRYTVDLVIHPLVRAGRVADVEALIEVFLATSSDKVKRDAFSVFLITLVQKGDISSARALFDTYIDEESAYFSVPADTRHFNVLIDGYRRTLETLRQYQDNEISSEDTRWNQLESKSKKEEAEMDRTLALVEGRRLYRKMIHLGITPDAYTLSSMMGLCTSSDEVTKLLDGSKAKSLTPAVIRSAITQCGRMKEPSLACQLFDQYVFPSMNIRVWNVLLGALAEGAKQDNIILNMKDESGGGVSSSLNGLKCSEATRVILDIMSDSTTKTKVPFPNSQTYCLTASALQYGSTDADLALELFRNATYAGIPADGRFVNAIFRCFGDDVNSALESWKGEIRRACLEHESRTQRAPRSIYRSRNKNLIAAYNGLLYVCGRALRPDVAVRLAYAMNKEGIEPDGISINNYRAGKRIQAQLHPTATGIDEGGSIQRGKFFSKLLSKPNMVEQYESLLYIECTKYDPNNRIMSKDKRIRIIV